MAQHLCPGTMFCRRITSFICIFVAAVIATAHNDSHSVTDSSTREPEQQVMETTAVDLGALLDAGDGAVITLVAGDTRLAAHRALLVARSSVLAATLQHMTLEASSGQVAIHDVEGPVLRQMLAYMYTQQAPQLPSMAPQLLVAADTYGLHSLKAHCEQQIAAQLSVETAAASAVLAVRHSCPSLREAAISFMKSHIFYVMVTQGWADAMNSQPEDLMEVIRLLSGTTVETSSRAPAASGTIPTSQPPSDHSGQTPASAAPTTAAGHTATPDYTTVSSLWSLSGVEKNRRLIEAAKEGAEDELEALITAGADLEAGDEWDMTALHWAASKGHVEVVRRLLASGASVEASDVVGRTPLHLAARDGHADVMRLLVEQPYTYLNPSSWFERTPLHYAASEGNAEVVAVLLQAGANRGAADRFGHTPLDDAINGNHHHVIDILTRS